jgi:glutathione peroxidase
VRAALGVVALAALACSAQASPPSVKDAVIAHDVDDIDGKHVSLSSYRGKVAMIVNVASECGFTPQYAGLEALYEKYRAQGFVVLGFPSNDFGGQEPGDADEIKKFTSEQFHVTFPLFAKLHATGPDIAPLYRTLTTQTKFPGEVKWNFTKFLVDKTGHVVARFPSEITPDDPSIASAVEAALR